LDLIGAVGTLSIASFVCGLLVAFSIETARVRLSLLAGAVGLIMFLVVIAKSGGFAPGVLGPVPTILLPFAVLTGVLCAFYLFSARVRRGLLAIPLPILVGVHSGRIGGVLFLLLYHSGRLTAPFAPVAGIGDILTGVFALLIALKLIVSPRVNRRWIRLWNVFGLMDLAAAVTLGALSATGAPYAAFQQAPGTRILSSLPWLFVPAFLVPIYILTHLVMSTRPASLHESHTQGSMVETGIV
jgi:hypothetical protein